MFKLWCERGIRYSNLKMSKLTTKRNDTVSDSIQMAIHFFVNFDIFKWLYLAYYWVYLHQTWDFVKLGLTLYFKTMWINSY